MHIPNTPPFRPAAGPAIVVSAQTAAHANLARAIAVLHLLGTTYHIPLFEAVGRDEIALTMGPARTGPTLGAAG